jgi:hypothetical protein
LPDGIFSYQKSQIGYILDGLDHFNAVLWPFVIACGPLAYFSRFGIFEPRKIWQPWAGVHYRKIVCQKLPNNSHEQSIELGS